jgi:hypothetical protein
MEAKMALGLVPFAEPAVRGINEMGTSTIVADFQ